MGVLVWEWEQQDTSNFGNEKSRERKQKQGIEITRY